MMEARKRSVLVVSGMAAAALAAVVLVLLLWKPAPAGIVAGVPELPDSLNPVMPQNTMGQDADELLFDGLVDFEVAPGGVVTTEFGLASSIEQDRATK